MTCQFDSPESVAESVGAMRDHRLTFSPRYDGFAYEASKVTRIRNGWNGLAKPHGGFWLSVDGSWERWCEVEEESWLSHGTYDVEISPDARIYVIASVADAEALPWHRDRGTWDGLGLPIDFEAMPESYDGVFVILSAGDSGLSRAMYGWDCDSVLLFSSDSIMGLRKVES